MIAKTKAIVLRNTNYSESSVISKMYTRSFGIRSYVMQSIRKGKVPIKVGMIQPLSIVDMEVYHKPNVDLGRVKELKNAPVLHGILSDIHKKSIALFYIEILNKCLTEELCEEELFDFLEAEILKLDKTDNVALLPHTFLLALTTHLGVQPFGQYSTSTAFLSIDQGAFIALEDIHCFNKEESKLASSILSLETDVHGSLPVRKRLLRQLIKYYQHHVMKDKNIRSVDVLAELLA